MGEFTKGPWVVGDFDDFTATYEVIQEGTVRKGRGYVVQTTICTECDKANARLIAAAPDLLEALEQAVTSMQDSGYPNSHVAVRAARQAIARARGEA